MNQDLAVTAADDVTRYDFGQVRMLFEEYKLRAARHAEDEAWLEQFKARAKEVSNNADEFVLDGEVVATLVAGQLNVGRIEKELPDIHQRYMRPVTKVQFDKERFQAENPGLFREYQARRFCVTGK
jgi:hypothetical protein